MKCKICFILFFSIVFSIPILSSADNIKKDFESLTWRSRQFAAEENFAEAIETLKQLKKIVDENRNKGLFYNIRLDQEIKVLKKLSVLPEVKNPAKYKIRVIFINQIDAEVLDKTGRKIKVKTVLKPGTVEKTKIFFEYQKYFIRAFSNGHLEVDVKYDNPGFTINKVIHHKTSMKNEFDPLYIEPEKDYSRYLFENYNNTDVFCFVWPKSGFKADAIGGRGMFYAVLPYIYKVPLRGYMAIPDTWIHSVKTRATFVHELFHTLEYNLGIGPSHAWYKNKRNKVPDWKGNGEYDYYQWRFNKTISKYGWENINYRKRFYMYLDKGAFENYIKFLKYSKIRRERAHQLVKEKKYNAALKLIPDYPEALYKLAKKLFAKNNIDAAEKLINRLLSIDSNNKNALLLKIRILLRQAEWDTAEKIITGLKNWQKPGYWERIPLVNEINVFIRRNKNKVLLERLYNMKILINPENSKYYRERAVFYLNKMYNIKKALADAQTAVKLDQGSAESLILLGEIYIWQEKFGKAEKIFKQAIENFPPIVSRISQLWLKMSRYEKDKNNKKRWIEKAIKYDPYSGYAYRALGLWYKSQHKRKSAVAALKKSVDLGIDKSLNTLQRYYGINDYKPKRIKKLKTNNAVRIAVFDIYKKEKIKYFDKIFSDFPDITISHISVDAVNIKNLKKYDIFLVPGGMSKEYSKMLQKQGKEAIKKFVEAGGHYIGICAGAYLGLSRKELGFFAGDTFNDRYWLRGTGDVFIELSDMGRKLLLDDSRLLRIRYANGPIIIRKNVKGLKPFKVLAYFKTGLAEHNAPDIMVNKPAIIYGEYGKGSALIFSPHPEYFNGREILLIKAVKYLGKFRK